MSDFLQRPPFSLNQLRYFAVAAELGSITLAGERLHIAQSAISAAIGNLEAELSVQLLIRDHARGVRLTEAGSSFLVRVRAVLAALQDLGEFGRDLGCTLAGDLRVGCYSYIAPFFLPALLERFAEAHPHVNVVLLEEHLEGLQQALLQGACDIALTYDVGMSARLATEVLARYAPQVILPPGHRLAGASSISLSDLADEPFIQFDLPHTRAYYDALARQAGVPLKPAYVSGNYEMVRGLVGRGRGYAILTLQPRSGLTYDGIAVVARPLAGDLPANSLVIAQVGSARLSRKAQAFAEVCRQFFAG